MKRLLLVLALLAGAPVYGDITGVVSPAGGGSAVSSVAGRTGAVTLSTADVSGLAPSATTDTTNKKPSVAAACDATCGNQTLSGAPTIDSFATTAGSSIVLLSAQTTGSQNGPWIVQSGAWTRPAWYASGSTTQVDGYSAILIRNGLKYQGTSWKQTNSAAITIDTTSTTWAVIPFALNASTVTGTLLVANGGTGAVTLSGLLKGNGTSAIAAAAAADVYALFSGTCNASTFLSGAGSCVSFASPPTIGGTAPAAITGTTVSGTQFLATQGGAGTDGYCFTSSTNTCLTFSSSTLVLSIGGTNYISMAGSVLSFAEPFQIGGTKFSTSGCSVSATAGGRSAGSYTSGTSGTCTVTVTMSGGAMNNGYSCNAWDTTTPADVQAMTASTTTTATFSGTTVSGDVIKFACIGF